jgi:hypothetical protein
MFLSPQVMRRLYAFFGMCAIVCSSAFISSFKSGLLNTVIGVLWRWLVLSLWAYGTNGISNGIANFRHLSDKIVFKVLFIVLGIGFLNLLYPPRPW